MSGLGKHKYSHEPKTPYGEPIAICPYCGNEDCRADWADVGVGMVQCGPFYCDSCYASEIGAHDKERKLSDKEKETGWYAPGKPLGSSVNTCNGHYVDHKTAKCLYELRLLDEKQLLSQHKTEHTDDKT